MRVACPVPLPTNHAVLGGRGKPQVPEAKSASDHRGWPVPDSRTDPKPDGTRPAPTPSHPWPGQPRRQEARPHAAPLRVGFHLLASASAARLARSCPRRARSPALPPAAAGSEDGGRLAAVSSKKSNSGNQRNRSGNAMLRERRAGPWSYSVRSFQLRPALQLLGPGFGARNLPPAVASRRPQRLAPPARAVPGARPRLAADTHREACPEGAGVADAGRGGERQRGEADCHDEASERHLRGPERQHDAGAARALAQAGQAAGQRGGTRRSGAAGRRHRAGRPHASPALVRPGARRRRLSSQRVRGKLRRVRGRPPSRLRGPRRPRAGSGPGRAGSREPAAPAGARAHAAAAAAPPARRPRRAALRPPPPAPRAPRPERGREPPLLPYRARAPPPCAGPQLGPEREPGAGQGRRRCGPRGPASALTPRALVAAGLRKESGGGSASRARAPASAAEP